jgi:hypothetical protein
MPYSNVPKHLWPKFERCTAALKAKGETGDKIYAICYSSIMKGEKEEVARVVGFVDQLLGERELDELTTTANIGTRDMPFVVPGDEQNVTPKTPECRLCGKPLSTDSFNGNTAPGGDVCYDCQDDPRDTQRDNLSWHPARESRLQETRKVEAGPELTLYSDGDQWYVGVNGKHTFSGQYPNGVCINFNIDQIECTGPDDKIVKDWGYEPRVNRKVTAYCKDEFFPKYASNPVAAGEELDLIMIRLIREGLFKEARESRLQEAPSTCQCSGDQGQCEHEPGEQGCGSTSAPYTLKSRDVTTPGGGWAACRSCAQHWFSRGTYRIYPDPYGSRENRLRETQETCRTCHAPLSFGGDIGAPGIGRSWDCSNGHSWVQVGNTWYDPTNQPPEDEGDPPWILSPGEVESRVGEFKGNDTEFMRAWDAVVHPCKYCGQPLNADGECENSRCEYNQRPPDSGDDPDLTEAAAKKDAGSPAPCYHAQAGGKKGPTQCDHHHPSPETAAKCKTIKATAVSGWTRTEKGGRMGSYSHYYRVDKDGGLTTLAGNKLVSHGGSTVVGKTQEALGEASCDRCNSYTEPVNVRIVALKAAREYFPHSSDAKEGSGADNAPALVKSCNGCDREVRKVHTGKKEARALGRCGCADAGCPVHQGVSGCTNPASEDLFRVDTEDRTGTPFCTECADDAWKSGVFAPGPGAAHSDFEESIQEGFFDKLEKGARVRADQDTQGMKKGTVYTVHDRQSNVYPWGMVSNYTLQHPETGEKLNVGNLHLLATPVSEARVREKASGCECENGCKDIHGDGKSVNAPGDTCNRPVTHMARGDQSSTPVCAGCAKDYKKNGFSIYKAEARRPRVREEAPPGGNGGHNCLGSDCPVCDFYRANEKGGPDPMMCECDPEKPEECSYCRNYRAGKRFTGYRNVGEAVEEGNVPRDSFHEPTCADCKAVKSKSGDYVEVCSSHSKYTRAAPEAPESCEDCEVAGDRVKLCSEHKPVNPFKEARLILGEEEEGFWVLVTDDESEYFNDYASAVAYANEKADELEADGWATDRSWASRDNMYGVRATKGGGYLTRDIQVVKAEGVGEAVGRASRGSRGSGRSRPVPPPA